MHWTQNKGCHRQFTPLHNSKNSLDTANNGIAILKNINESLKKTDGVYFLSVTRQLENHHLSFISQHIEPMGSFNHVHDTFFDYPPL
jgi:hypothetical protein